MRIRFKTAALLAILAAVGGFVAFDAARETPAPERVDEGAKAPRSAEPNTPPSVAQAGSAEPQAFALPERPGFGKSQSPLFESQTWQPPPPKIPPAAKIKPGPPPAPVAPPLPYTFAGRLVHDGKLSLLLARGDEVIAIREGDTLVVTPIQLIAIRKQVPQELEQSILVEMRGDEGYAVLRTFVPTESRLPAATAFLANAGCEPFAPDQ